MKTLITITLALLLTSCGLKPETIKNAVIGHATFPALSAQVQNCIAGRSDVYEAIKPAWNRTFDKWEMTKDLKPDVNLLHTLAGAPAEFAEAERDAMFIEQTIVAAGLDCGEFVRNEWGRIKVTFVELKTAINSNQRIVVVAEYASLLSAIVQGKDVAKVGRM